MTWIYTSPQGELLFTHIGPIFSDEDSPYWDIVPHTWNHTAQLILDPNARRERGG